MKRIAWIAISALAVAVAMAMGAALMVFQERTLPTCLIRNDESDPLVAVCEYVNFDNGRTETIRVAVAPQAWSAPQRFHQKIRILRLTITQAGRTRTWDVLSEMGFGEQMCLLPSPQGLKVTYGDLPPVDVRPLGNR